MNSDPGDGELHNTVGERCEREVETSDTLPSSASMSELSFIFSIIPPVSTLPPSLTITTLQQQPRPEGNTMIQFIDLGQSQAVIIMKCFIQQHQVSYIPSTLQPSPSTIYNLPINLRC